MTATTWRRGVAAATLLLGCVAVLLTGCAPGSEEAIEEEWDDGWTAACQQVLDSTVASDGPTVVVIVDGTASGQDVLDTPSVTAAVAQAQQLAHEQDRSAVLVAVPVDGPGAPVRVTQRLPLDPYPGTSPNSDRARRLALDCVPMFLRHVDLAPTMPGSDIVQAIDTASRQQPMAIVLVSDGVSTGAGAALDVATLGFDPEPAATVEALVAQGVSVPGADVAVTWVGGAATTAVPLPYGARQGVEEVVMALLGAGGAKAALETDTASIVPRSVEGLPEDLIALPEAEVVQTGVPEVTCTVLPSAMLFEPDSAEITEESAVAEIAAQVAGAPAVLVVGHTADFGSPDAQVAFALSRAESVRAGLQAAGVTAPIETAGRGSAQPAVPEWRADGSHDLAAAAQNRRVEVLFGPAELLVDARCAPA